MWCYTKMSLDHCINPLDCELIQEFNKMIIWKLCCNMPINILANVRNSFPFK